MKKEGGGANSSLYPPFRRKGVHLSPWAPPGYGPPSSPRVRPFCFFPLFLTSLEMKKFHQNLILIYIGRTYRNFVEYGIPVTIFCVICIEISFTGGGGNMIKDERMTLLSLFFLAFAFYNNLFGTNNS